MITLREEKERHGAEGEGWSVTEEESDRASSWWRRERERCKDMTPPVSILWLRWNTHDSTVTLRYALTLLHLAAAAGGQAGVRGRRQDGEMKGEVRRRRERAEGQRKEKVEKVWRRSGVIEWWTEEEDKLVERKNGRKGTDR